MHWIVIIDHGGINQWLELSSFNLLIYFILLSNRLWLESSKRDFHNSIRTRWRVRRQIQNELWSRFCAGVVRTKGILKKHSQHKGVPSSIKITNAFENVFENHDLRNVLMFLSCCGKGGKAYYQFLTVHLFFICFPPRSRWHSRCVRV